MNIAMIVFNVVERGTYWRAFHLGRNLCSHGHSVTLIATSRASRKGIHVQQQDGVTLVETPDLFTGSLRSGWDPWNTLQRMGWLRSRHFDLVHAFESRPTVIFPALYLKRRQGIPLFMDWCDWFGRGGSVEERPNPLVRTVLRPVETYFENNYRQQASGTTVINSFLRNRAIDFGINPEKIVIIRNGSNVDFKPMDMCQARQQVGLPKQSPIIGFAGGTYARDAQFMAEAFNHVIRENPQVKLLLVGSFNREIEGWLSNPAAVIRTGWVETDQIYTYLSGCNLCWLPLTKSGANLGRWPLKLNDYMAVGRPTVVTAVGDLVDIVPQHGLGVVTSDDPVIFSRATLELLQDTDWQYRLGRSARTAAERTFNWKFQAKQLEEFYVKMLHARDGNSRQQVD